MGFRPQLIHDILILKKADRFAATQRDVERPIAGPMVRESMLSRTCVAMSRNNRRYISLVYIPHSILSHNSIIINLAAGAFDDFQDPVEGSCVCSE
jgi:hypothetical protein